jgi:hypothetical protein
MEKQIIVLLQCKEGQRWNLYYDKAQMEKDLELEHKHDENLEVVGQITVTKTAKLDWIKV